MNTQPTIFATPVVRVSLALQQAVHDGLATEAEANQRSVTEHIQHLLTNHAVEKGLLDQGDRRRVQLMWRLVDQTVDAARAICREGAFDSAITLSAIRRCMTDPQWVRDYREFVQDDIFKNGNPLKGSINREIGYQIRKGIGGVVKTDANAKPVMSKVLGEIIQSYTEMKSFDPDIVTN